MGAGPGAGTGPLARVQYARTGPGSTHEVEVIMGPGPGTGPDSWASGVPVRIQIYPGAGPGPGTRMFPVIKSRILTTLPCHEKRNTVNIRVGLSQG